MPFANNNGVKIHYEVEGEANAPVLVMQHGLTSSIETWRENGYPANLPQQYRVIMIDARGHGRSDKPHDPNFYSPQDFTSDILTVMDSLGIKRASYWGYSMGGAIGY
jgi:pimeloyl-ACP methyl ester carboxylesterase